MNSADKEAFNAWRKTQDLYIHAPERDVWQAACEYKDKQLAAKDALISKLREALAYLRTRVIDIQDIQDINQFLTIPNDNTALKEALKQAIERATSGPELQEVLRQARKNALLDAAEWFEKNHVEMIYKCQLHSEELRRMAEGAKG